MSYSRPYNSPEVYLGKIVSVTVTSSPNERGVSDALLYKTSGRYHAYVIGAGRDSTRFTGRVIGLVHRESEGRKFSKHPDAIVVAPAEMKINQAEIAELLFTEGEATRYHIEPLYHKSCGAIVYRHTDDGLEFLILNELHSDKWGFPKGHMERGEDEVETARREIHEEAGFHAEFKDGFREEIHYRISATVEKSVVYFLSEYDGPIHIRKNEIAKYTWISPADAKAYLYRANLVRIIEKAKAAVLQAEI